VTESIGAVAVLLILMVVLIGIAIFIAMKIKRYDEGMRGKDKK